MSNVFKSLAVVGVLLLFTASVARAQPTSISVDAKDAVIANGTAITVTGFIVCSTMETFQVTVDVLQNHAGTSTIGAGMSSGPTDCAGIPQPYSVLVQAITPANGTFKSGPASVLFVGSTTSSGMTTQGAIMTATIHLD